MVRWWYKQTDTSEGGSCRKSGSDIEMVNQTVQTYYVSLCI